MTDSTRPPNKPSTPPPPKPAPKPAAPTKAAADDLMDLADSLGFKTPARRSAMDAMSAHAIAAEETGGPVDVPVVRARDDGRVDGADGTATFTLPDTRVPLRFGAGEHRLVGLVEALLTPDS